MVRTDDVYQKYVSVLEEELLPAMGCTEPIAIAYAAAKAREVLGDVPERVFLAASGNIIKNVKSVVVPNTGHMRGIYAAVAAGIVAGKADKQLEVIASVTPEEIEKIKEYMKTTEIKVDLADSGLIFDIDITVYKGNDSARVRIVDNHTNIVLIQKGEDVILSKEISKDNKANNITDRSFMSVEGILDFADSVEIADIEPLISRQIEYNMAIAEEGLKNSYGANIGSVLLASNKSVLEQGGEAAIKLKARAMAAAGSDARMNGCELPVIINSGSGNQGITASVPVVVYARELGVGKEKMYRALVLSNLLAIHQKTPIGRLSAYCGVVNAGVGAGCGITYLKGGRLDEIAHTLVNSLAIASGVICDGAKASCAAKIGLAVENGIMGYEMYCQGQQFVGGDGIVKTGVENMIASVGRLGREGMRETDKEILKIMLDN